MSCSNNCRKPRGRLAHCGACHRTFSGVSTFDDHRKGGRCNDPAGLGMREANGVWRGSDPDPRFTRLVAP